MTAITLTVLLDNKFNVSWVEDSQSSYIEKIYIGRRGKTLAIHEAIYSDNFPNVSNDFQFVPLKDEKSILLFREASSSRRLVGVETDQYVSHLVGSGDTLVFQSGQYPGTLGGDYRSLAKTFKSESKVIAVDTNSGKTLKSQDVLSIGIPVLALANGRVLFLKWLPTGSATGDSEKFAFVVRKPGLSAERFYLTEECNSMNFFYDVINDSRIWSKAGLFQWTSRYLYGEPYNTLNIRFDGNIVRVSNSTVTWKLSD
jgi:hypothetical protein